MSKKGIGTGAVQLALVLVLVALWELGAVTRVLNPFFFSSPDRIGGALLSLVRSGALWGQIWTTMYETIVGFVIGGSLGVLIGLVVSRSAFILRVLDPFIYFFYSLPRIAVAPLFIVLFGLGTRSKVVTVVFTVLFILLINTIAGVKQVQPLWIQSARIMGANSTQISVHVVLPGVMAWIFAGIRVAVSLAFGAAIVAEFTGSTAGVGYELLISSTNFDTTGVMTWILVLGVLALILTLLAGFAESHLLSWRTQTPSW